MNKIDELHRLAEELENVTRPIKSAIVNLIKEVKFETTNFEVSVGSCFFGDNATVIMRQRHEQIEIGSETMTALAKWWLALVEEK